MWKPKDDLGGGFKEFKDIVSTDPVSDITTIFLPMRAHLPTRPPLTRYALRHDISLLRFIPLSFISHVLFLTDVTVALLIWTIHAHLSVFCDHLNMTMIAQ
jgi:hypothetical protein